MQEETGNYQPKVFTSVCDMYASKSILRSEYGSNVLAQAVNLVHKQLQFVGLAKGSLNYEEFIKGQAVHFPPAQVAGVRASLNYGKIPWNVADPLLATVVPSFRDVRLQGESTSKLVPQLVPMQFDVLFPSKLRMANAWQVADASGMVQSTPRLYPSKAMRNDEPAQTVLNATVSADVHDFNMAVEAFFRLVGMHAIDLYRAKIIDYVDRNDANGFKTFTSTPVSVIVGLRPPATMDQDNELRFSRKVASETLNQFTWPEGTYFSKALLGLCVGNNECRSMSRFARNVEEQGVEAVFEGIMNAHISVH